MGEFKNPPPPLTYVKGVLKITTDFGGPYHPEFFPISEFYCTIVFSSTSCVDWRGRLASGDFLKWCYPKSPNMFQGVILSLRQKMTYGWFGHL